MFVDLYTFSDPALKPVFIPELVKSLIKRCKLRKNCLIDDRVALLKSVFVGLEGVEDLVKLSDDLGNEGRKNVIGLVEEIVSNGYYEIPRSTETSISGIETAGNFVEAVDGITEKDDNLVSKNEDCDNGICDTGDLFILFGKQGIQFIKICVGDEFSAEIIHKIGVNPELVGSFCSKLELTTSNCSYLLNKLKFPISFRFIEHKVLDKHNCKLIMFVKLVQNFDSLLHGSLESTAIIRSFLLIHTLALPIQKYMHLMLTFDSNNLQCIRNFVSNNLNLVIDLLMAPAVLRDVNKVDQNKVDQNFEFGHFWSCSDCMLGAPGINF